jgi:hypothetical protein
MAWLAVILPGDRGPHFTFRTGRRALTLILAQAPIVRVATKRGTV